MDVFLYLLVHRFSEHDALTTVQANVPISALFYTNAGSEDVLTVILNAASSRRYS
jgi:hypothetical protein